VSAFQSKLMRQRQEWMTDRGIRETGDCGVVTLAAVTHSDYTTAHAYLRSAGRDYREPTYQDQFNRALQRMGWKAVKVFSVSRVVRNIDINAKTLVTLERELWKKYHGRRFAIYSYAHVSAFHGAGLVDTQNAPRARVTDVYEITPIEKPIVIVGTPPA